jgi:hypothetical protein
MKSSAMPLKWHEECLRNRQSSLARAEQNVRDAVANADRLRKDMEHLALQIEEAKRRGMTAFDRDRLLKRR